MEFPRVLSDGGDWCIIYTVSGKGPQPIHGAYWSGDELGWLMTQWDKEGQRNPGNVSKLSISKAIQRGELHSLFQKEEVTGRPV